MESKKKTVGYLCGLSAINAKEIQVTFNNSVEKSDVIEAGTPDTLVDGVFTIDEVGTANAVAAADGLSASLSEDGKTLTITADTAFDGQYAFTLKQDTVQTTDGSYVAPYSSVFTANDVTRPSVKGVSYLDNQTARVQFSEPLKAAPSIAFTYADGTAATVTGTLTAGNDYIDFDVSGADPNKDITATLIGTSDYNDNLISPNPVKVTLKYDTTDTTAPTVSSVTATSNKSFDVLFSEALVADPTVGVTTGTVDTITKDSDNPKLYHVTLTGAVSGLQTVSLAAGGAYTDLSHNDGAAYSKVVNFDVDVDGPTVASTSVVKIDGVEYLVVNYNENVTPVDAIAIDGSYVDNYVTNSVTITTDTDGTASTSPISLYNAVNGKSKSVKIDLSLLSQGDYTVNLPAGLVTDNDGNNSEAKNSVTFARSTNNSIARPALDTSYDTNGLDQTGQNEVEVRFDSKVDPVSALTKSNYSIEGVTIKNVTLTSNTASGAVVKLTLDASTNTFSGLHTVTISGVKGETGAVMNSVTTSESLTENVQPTVTAAALTDVDEITLTFSEAIDATTLNDGDDAEQDFDVYVGGVKYTGTVTEATVDGTHFTLTLGGNLTPAQVSSGIVVKPTADNDVEDSNGNLLDFTSITVK